MLLDLSSMASAVLHRWLRFPHNDKPDFQKWLSTAGHGKEVKKLHW